MNLDDAIKHCEEIAMDKTNLAQTLWDSKEKARCKECAEEHNQLAQWLIELKMLKTEQEPSGSEIPNKWIPCSERLPKTDNENSINSFNVLLWVKNKTHPEREAQIYLGKLKHVDGDDGSGNFWGMKIEPCEWTIWGWSYFNEPEVIAWMPLPEPYREVEK